MPVSRGFAFAPAVLTTWGGDEEEAVVEAVMVDVPFAAAVAVVVTTPVAVEQIGLATRFVRLGQTARAELICEMWAL
jgi:hypothetical protein